MKKIVIITVIAICMTLSAGFQFASASDAPAKETPETMKVIETVEEDTVASKKPEKMMSPDEIKKIDEMEKKAQEEMEKSTEDTKK